MKCDDKQYFLGFIGTNNTAGKTPLWISCSKGHFDIAKLLIDNGAYVNIPDSDSMPPLAVACFNGHSKIAQYLIDRGADLKKSAIKTKNYDGQTPLFFACKHGFFETVKLIIENCNDLMTLTLIERNDQITGRTPLYAACVSGHLEIAAFLIKNGADINVRDHTGRSIIDWASANGKTGFILFLISPPNEELKKRENNFIFFMFKFKNCRL